MAASNLPRRAAPVDLTRRAVPADLPRLRALQACLDAPWPALLELAVGDGPADDAPFALVIEVGASDAVGPAGPAASIVGYALAIPGRRAVAETVPENEGGVYVAELGVAPGFRREGLGSALLDAVEAAFPGRDHLWLTARSDNERALAFYRANGFRVRDRIHGHYEDGDGVVLVRGRDGSGRSGSGQHGLE